MPTIGEVFGRVRRTWHQKGTAATLRFLLSRLFRHQRHVTYEADCQVPRTPSCWESSERMIEIGPDNLDDNLTPELQKFLGGEEAYEGLQGVRGGNRLFVITNGNEYVHRGYILFHTRQTKILGDREGAPLIAYCATLPSARGRGLYRRALNAELCYLQRNGYTRALIETDPENLPSRRGIESAGFKLAWETRVWIIVNWLVVQRIRKNGVTRLACFRV